MPIPTEPGVYLFEHIDYEGRMLRLTKTSKFLAVAGLFSGGIGNGVSSWAVVGDYSATLFSMFGLLGRRSTLGLRNGLVPGGSRSECPDLRLGPPSLIGITGDRGCFGDVRNDEAASVGIGTAAYNAYASDLFWPRGTWALNAGTAGGVSAIAFAADGTYEWSTVPAHGAHSLLRGRWRVVPFDIQVPLRPHGLLMYESVDLASGNAVARPDQLYPYDVVRGNPTVLELRFGGAQSMQFEFRPERFRSARALLSR